MNRRSSLRSHAAVQFKLLRIVSHHEQLKVAFYHLQSQVRTGLHEKAEDVFASLAIPLTKLVGLKTVEMASEGRFSTVVTSIDCSLSQFVFKSQEDNYMTRAMAASKDLMERQKQRFIELITLLKKIENQVNSSQNIIYQNLADHRAFMKKFFIKAFTCISEIQHSGHSEDLPNVMRKILKATYDQVGAALRSVEVGIDDMMHELAEKMCSPMVEYANGIKNDMKTGICSHLLEIVKEMDSTMKLEKFQLEEARKQATLAEQSRSEALIKLQKSEEIAGMLTKSLQYLTEDNSVSNENLTQEKSLGTKEDHAKDENLLWDMLRVKRKGEAPHSPLRTKEDFLGIEASHKKLKLARVNPSLTTSQAKISSRQSVAGTSGMRLGSSPSAPTRKVLLRKRITP